MNNTYLENINIILHKTIHPGNIGSVARAMKNMGLSKLSLVDPQCEVSGEARKMATHGKEILDNIRICDSIIAAAADANYIFGTTARSRKWRNSILCSEASSKIAGLGKNCKIAILFGPEDKGLSNNDLELCSSVIVIPTADDASSLNISQAVLIICYEIFIKLTKVNLSPAENELTDPAPIDKIEAMYQHMQKALLDIGYLDPQNPEHFTGNIRRIFSRSGLTNEEVQLIRGIFRKLNWYIRHH